jgi:hypothetical protein
MMSIIGQMITDSSGGDTDTDTHEDEHGGIPTVINMTQEQLAEIGSNKLPSSPWDLRVHFVGSLFHLMMIQAAPESHILFFGLVLSGPVGICPMERGSFSLLIIMIGHGDGWASIASTEMFLRMHLLDGSSNCHRYFSLRIQEWRI